MPTPWTGARSAGAYRSYEHRLQELEENPRATRLAGTKSCTVRQYLRVCTDNELESLPLRYVTVASFLVWFVDGQLGRTASMAGKKSHLKTSARLMGIPWLSESDEMKLKRVESELKKIHGK